MRALDIGSAGGNDYPWEWVGFEPHEGSFALADVTGEAPFYVTRNPDASSLLKPNMALLSQFPVGPDFEVVEETTTKIERLDALGLSADFIKIDVQGAEGMVIRGGMQTIGNAAAVQVEVNFAERYIGCSRFSDVDVLLRSLGFSLHDIKRRYLKRDPAIGGPKGQLTHGDALYLKEAGVPSEILEYFGYAGTRSTTFPAQAWLAHGLARLAGRLMPNPVNGRSGDEHLGNIRSI